MNTNENYAAPWGGELRLMTALALTVLLGVALIGVVSFPHRFFFLRWGLMVALPLILLIGSSFFMVRGYSLNDHKLIIHRLGWSSSLDLQKLVSAAPDSSAFSGSVRLAGNGGLFAICGLFRSRNLGNFRAFATDPHRSVVLRFSDRTVVVTPDAPDRFVDEVAKLK